MKLILYSNNYNFILSADTTDQTFLSINFPQFSRKKKAVKILSNCNGELQCFNGSTMGMAIGSTIMTTIKGKRKGAIRI